MPDSIDVAEAVALLVGSISLLDCLSCDMTSCAVLDFVWYPCVF